MRKILAYLLLLSICVMAAACSTQSVKEEEKPAVKIGMMMSDVGLGDQSFSDVGFAGLEKARDEMGIVFDYREIQETKTYEQGLEELVKQDNQLVIGLGFAMQEALEAVAKKYPEQQFLIIDAVSELPNVHSVTFKEEEGSFLIGVLAGMKTKTNKIGFIGGMDVPVIRKFEKGFVEGVKQVNPQATIISAYANDFGNDQLGKQMGKQMIDQGVDIIYPAAGFTGVGVLLEAQSRGKYAFGVDTDQYFLAEKAVLSSMLKKIDVAVYDVAKQLVQNGKLAQKDMVLGIAQNGVGLAPVRVLPLTEQEKGMLEQLEEKLKSGSIQITP
ncbi:MAG TPA: BMP family ABC transporter substrate-binding protein [Candidatus Bathyarchaeia archaeon]|nr:BMP family ABC transporter substrate-binding protein [Candidatus Bathyarchaeia archaeon]